MIVESNMRQSVEQCTVNYVTKWSQIYKNDCLDISLIEMLFIYECLETSMNRSNAVKTCEVFPNSASSFVFLLKMTVHYVGCFYLILRPKEDFLPWQYIEHTRKFE